MKKTISFFSKATALLMLCFFASSYKATAQKIEFETLEINYGDIKKGADGVRKFKFRNTGIAPVTITNAQGSCGCAVPTKPDEPIMPGASDVIKVKYDTKRVGPFTKQVTITTDANETVRLTIRGNVLPEPEPEPVPVPAPQPNPKP